MSRIITREEFDQATEAIWSELEYQNDLPRRIADEARTVPRFLNLARVYMDRTAADWADNPGESNQGHGSPVVVPKALHGLRKSAAVLVRGMIYCGIRFRNLRAERAKQADQKEVDLSTIEVKMRS